MAVAVVSGGIVATNASAETYDASSMTPVAAVVPVTATTAKISDAAHLVPKTTVKAKPKPVAKAHRKLTASRSQVRHPAKGTVAYSKWYAKTTIAAKYGWGSDEMSCLVTMWNHESEWKTNADDSDNGYTWGIPQARPGSKMASAGSDWRTNPETQIRWGLSYIKSTYGSPCQAWSFWQDHSWY
jgi:hypothetical protein